MQEAVSQCSGAIHRTQYVMSDKSDPQDPNSDSYSMCMAILKNRIMAQSGKREGKIGGEVSITSSLREILKKPFTPRNKYFTFGSKKGTHMEKVIVLNSDKMGEGDEKLGRRLIANFLKTLVSAEKNHGCPNSGSIGLVLYNSGVKLTVKDSPVLESLQSLENLGVEIICCGTCVNFYGLVDLIQAGRVTNMSEIVKVLTEAENIVTL
jgi:selenium metabolism protein YedF